MIYQLRQKKRLRKEIFASKSIRALKVSFPKKDKGSASGTRFFWGHNSFSDMEAEELALQKVVYPGPLAPETIDRKSVV